jgi:hypothetical protein
MDWLKRLQRFDVYAKTLDDFRVKTTTGAASRNFRQFFSQNQSTLNNLFLRGSNFFSILLLLLLFKKFYSK